MTWITPELDLYQHQGVVCPNKQWGEIVTARTLNSRQLSTCAGMGFGNQPPVHSLLMLLDLIGSVKLVAPSQSNAVFDHNADGTKSAVGWRC